MQDSELYKRLLDLKTPWKVSSAELRMEETKVRVRVSHDRSAKFERPECGRPASVYDDRRGQWRHLDRCGLVTMIEAEVPRVSCSEHGVGQVPAPWAESGIGFTALFEAMAISWLKGAPINAVGERRLSGQAGVLATDSAEPEDLQSVADQGSGRDAVVTPLSRGCRAKRETPSRLDLPLSPRAHGQRRKDGPPIPVGY